MSTDPDDAEDADAEAADAEDAEDDIEFVVDSVRQAEKHLEEHEKEKAERLREVSESMEDLTGTERAPDERRIHAHRETLQELHGEVMNEDARLHLQQALGRLSDMYEPSTRH